MLTPWSPRCASPRRRLTALLLLASIAPGCVHGPRAVWPSLRHQRHLPDAQAATPPSTPAPVHILSDAQGTTQELQLVSHEPSPNQEPASDTMKLNGILDASLAKKFEAPIESDVSNPSISQTNIDAASGEHVVAPLSAADLAPAFRDLTEAEMLSQALAGVPALRTLGIRILSSPEATSTVYDRAIEATDPFFGPAAALAEFDSRLSASLNTEKNDRVFNNATLGGDVQELVQDTTNAQLGWQKRAWNGAIVDIQSIQLYDNNNRVGNRFPNYWESLMEAGVRQPLLRGGGRQFNAIAGPNAQPGFNFSNGIIIARLNTHISDADFQIALRTFVQDLYASYWALHREYRSLESLVASRDLAYETWQSTLAKKNADLKGGEADKEAQARARYFQLRRDVANALDGQDGRGGYYVTERQLRQLMGLPVVDGQVLRPIDPAADVRYVFDYDQLVARGVRHRAEIRRQNIRVQQQQYRLIAAKNFLLPQLDLVGRYRLRGFGDDLTGSGTDRFASAAKDFYSFDHQEWQFGVEMGVPVGRRQAKAAVSNAKLELSRQRTILEEQQRALQYEISDAHAEIASAFEALGASRAIMQANQDRLDSSQVLYSNDKLQIEFLLDAQQQLVQAQQQLAEDQSRYSLAIINLNATTGTLLRDLGISVAVDPCGVQDVRVAVQ